MTIAINLPSQIFNSSHCRPQIIKEFSHLGFKQSTLEEEAAITVSGAEEVSQVVPQPVLPVQEKSLELGAGQGPRPRTAWEMTPGA